MQDPPLFAKIATGAVAILIVAASGVALFIDSGAFDSRQGQFTFAVTDTLLPLFQAMLTALVGYALGKRLVDALKRPAQSDRHLGT